ncbi:FadR/GntR family transcriptional regulator [Desulfosarcina ovata]|uniref:Pyruvate dehydrogenase complex repressor n=2 Tax=Desulfosarcina ovata TaxID=83564 RepID=A0A5K8AI18_9BACT|nr:FadR/GntR family transcriptional regulator [Desulfosarcina ovata]BBO82802.1 GntR family transcriptional regulator [Desulfosarcina ovata subsp. sediminis]BBO91474.1 GntR family transcriptional regulator [Desulfosarcina ovata subsp. ovata]
MPPSIKPIRPKRISDQVFDQLRELIFRGEFKAGEKIITEREMAAAFGVSRTSVRDAINKLVVMGLLEQRQGQGTFVRSPESRKRSLLATMVKSQDASLTDVLEVRLGLECNAAAMAAVRADEKDFRFMEKSIEAMEKEINAGRLSSEADVSFHMAVSYATKNRLQVLIMKNVYDYLFTGVQANLEDLYQNPVDMQTIPEQHRAIYRAIRANDPETAHQAMKQHIEYVDQMIARQGR